MATVKRALLIGPSYASDLPGIRQLKGVQNDLRLMRDMLSRNGFHPENIMELEGDEASYDNILLTLGKLSFMAEERSVVVIYFSGHGWQIRELDDTAIENKYFDQGILPAGLTKEMVDEYHIRDVCITGEHFTPHLLKLLKKGCLVNTIFDCSFGCLKTDSATLKQSPQLEFSKKVLQEYHEIFKDRSPKNLSGKQPMKHDNELAFSRKHMQEPHGISTARSPINQSEKQPTKYDNEPMEHEYYHQNLRPSSPMRQYSRLQYPVQEFGTPALSWTPSDDDKFISIAATTSTEYAYECYHPDTKVICGRLTSTLVEVVDEAQREGKRISYNILKSQIKRRFAEKKWTGQTPQFECGDMNLVLFGFDRVKQLIAIEICESKLFQGFTKVKLNAGKLHGVVDGEYDVYTPDVTEEEVNPEVITRRSIDTIIVNRGDIDLLTSRGATLFKRDGIQHIVRAK